MEQLPSRRLVLVWIGGVLATPNIVRAQGGGLPRLVTITSVSWIDYEGLPKI